MPKENTQIMSDSRSWVSDPKRSNQVQHDTQLFPCQRDIEYAAKAIGKLLGVEITS